MKVLITGAGGQLGRDLQLALAGEVPAGGPSVARRLPRGLEIIGADRQRLPVTERAVVLAAVEGLRPDVIIHSAARTDVDGCEDDPDGAFSTNAMGTRHVAEAAGRVGAHLVYISTDYVFDGTVGRPYREWDEPNPLSVYGASKLAGERECPPSATIVRTAWLAGANGENAVRRVLRRIYEEAPLRVVDDQRGSPTFTADLAIAISTLALERLPGAYHVTNGGAATRWELARAVVSATGQDPGRVEAITTADLDPAPAARRPADSSLENAAWRSAGLAPLAPWQEALDRFVAALGLGRCEQ